MNAPVHQALSATAERPRRERAIHWAQKLLLGTRAFEDSGLARIKASQFRSWKPEGLLDDLLRITRENGGAVVFDSPMGKPFVVLSDPAALQHILVRGSAAYGKQNGHGVQDHFRRTQLEDGSATSHWTRRVSATYPIADEDFQGALLEASDRLSDSLCEPGPQDRAPQVTRFWRDFMAEFVLGAPSGKHMFPVWLAHDALIQRLNSPLVHALPFGQYLPAPGNVVYRASAAVARQAILSRVTAGTQTSWSMLHRLGELAPELSDADRLEVCMSLFFNGTTTVHASLTWALWHLAASADVRARLLQEIEPLRHQRPSVQLVSNLPYLDAVWREVLRLYSPVHIGRHALREDLVVGKYRLPAGTDVMTNAWFIHRNPDVWSRPKEFIPERFIDSSPGHAEYLPFSLGARGCPGKLLSHAVGKLVLFRLLSRLRVATCRSPRPGFMPSMVLPTLPSALPVSFHRGT